jgi:hypothetical protein
MIKKQKTIFFVLFFGACIFAFRPVFAAEFIFNSNSQNGSVGDEFEIGFFLNTENESINAVESTIVFPQDLFELKEIKNGNSIISFWAQPPKASGNRIHFSGVVPGGYIGQKGFVFSVIFQALAQGEGLLEIRDAIALRNDGKGTRAEAKIANFKFPISNQLSIAQITKPAGKDTEPPELFKPEIGRDDSIFSGKFFLAFVTQDKGSGIDHYEVCEGKRGCLEAESIYLLKNQNLNEEIIVKAIDKNGNERTVALPVQKRKPRYLNYLYGAILIVIVMFVYIYIKKKRNKN